MKPAYVITAIQVAILAVLLLTKACEERTGETIVPVRVPLSSVTVIDSTPQVQIDMAAVRHADRQEVARLQDTIDALRARIAAMGGRTTFRTDTLLQPGDRTEGGRPDTIMIECDETNRRIALQYAFAPRIVDVAVPNDKPFLQGVAAAGVQYDLQRLSPRVMLGAIANISDNLGLQLGVETRLSPYNGAITTAFTTDLRWTF